MQVVVTQLRTLLATLKAQVACRTFLLEAAKTQPDSRAQGKTQSRDERQAKLLGTYFN